MSKSPPLDTFRHLRFSRQVARLYGETGDHLSSADRYDYGSRGILLDFLRAQLEFDALLVAKGLLRKGSR